MRMLCEIKRKVGTSLIMRSNKALSRFTACVALSLTFPFDHFFFFAALPPDDVAATLALAYNEIRRKKRVLFVSDPRRNCYPTMANCIQHANATPEHQSAQQHPCRHTFAPPLVEYEGNSDAHHCLAGLWSMWSVPCSPKAAFWDARADVSKTGAFPNHRARLGACCLS